MFREERPMSIDEVSHYLKIPKHTLRYWEKEFEGLLVPLRTQGRQRRYHPKDIALVEEIKKMRSRGRSLSEIKEALTHSDRRNNIGVKGVELFANRVADAVKTEVYRFFEGGEEQKSEEMKRGDS
jgi:DNA-binding transcriptional MerR regulator